MPWYILMYLLSTLIDWIRIGRLSDQEKDLETLLLRQQLGIAERKLHKPVRVSRVERMTIAVLTTKLRSSGSRTVAQLRQIIRIFQPETVLGWHRQLVKRKWTYNPDGRDGRPRIDRELESLVVRLAQENHDWACWLLCQSVAPDRRKMRHLLTRTLADLQFKPDKAPILQFNSGRQRRSLLTIGSTTTHSH